MVQLIDTSQLRIINLTEVQIGPSYKQYDYLPGLDAVQISGLDPNQLATDFTNSGTINEAEGWVAGFDPPSCKRPDPSPDGPQRLHHQQPHQPHGGRCHRRQIPGVTSSLPTPSSSLAAATAHCPASCNTTWPLPLYRISSVISSTPSATPTRN